MKTETAGPLNFLDLSLSLSKLPGKGEYMIEFPGDDSEGFFGLAVKD